MIDQPRPESDPSRPGKAAALALRIARGESVAEAARAEGLPSSTAYRWAKAPKFKARVDDYRRRLIDRALGKLSDAACEAHGEPPRTGADVGDDRGLGDPERIHDLIGVLPDVPIGCFEEAEILRWKQAAVRLAARLTLRDRRSDGCQ